MRVCGACLHNRVAVRWPGGLVRPAMSSGRDSRLSHRLLLRGHHPPARLPSKKALRSAREYMGPTAWKPLAPVGESATCNMNRRTLARYGWRASHAVAKGIRPAKRGGSATEENASSLAIRRAPRCAARGTVASPLRARAIQGALSRRGNRRAATSHWWVPAHQSSPAFAGCSRGGGVAQARVFSE